MSMFQYVYDYIDDSESILERVELLNENLILRENELENATDEKQVKRINSKYKRRFTCIIRYGVEHILYLKEVKDRQLNTIRERYNVENVAQAQEVKDKIKDIFNERYDGHPMYDEDVKNKVNQTNLERYDGHPMQNPEIREKVKQTNLERYDGHPFKNDKVKAKIRNTMIKNHKVDNPLKCPEIRKKVFANRKYTKLEQRVIDILKSRNIEFKTQYIVTKDSISHTYDFAIFKDSKIDTLVNTDGVYFHAYLSDPNGKFIGDYYDHVRLHLVPEDVKYVQVIENTFNEGMEYLFKILDMTHYEYVQDMYTTLSQEFPYPDYSDKILHTTFNNIISHTINNFNNRHSYGSKISRHFHKSFFTPYIEPFNNQLMYAIEQGFMYIDFTDPSRVLNGFNHSGILPESNYFSATLSKYLITKYLKQLPEIFDPNPEYSGRLLGAIGSSKKYTGLYSNATLYNEAINLVKYFNINEHVNLVQESNNQYDCIFTRVSNDSEIDKYINKHDCKVYLFVIDNETTKYKDYIKEELISKTHFNEIKQQVILINQ